MRQFRFFIFLFGVLIFNGGFGQSSQKADSLLNVLPTVRSDTAKITTYLAIYKESVELDTANAIKYLNLAIDLSEEIDDDVQICRSYLALGNFHWKKGNLEDAKTALTHAGKLLANFKNDALEATFFMEKGLINYYGGIYDIAIESFLNASEKYEELGDNTGEVKSYSNIGICFMELEELDKALEYYLKAAEKLEDQSDEYTLSAIWGNIGIIFRRKEDYKKALEYYLKSLEMNRRVGSKLDEAINLHNIGSLYIHLKEYRRAAGHLEEARKISSEINDKIGILYADHALARVFIRSGKYKEGIPLLHSSLTFAEELNSRQELRDINFHLSQAYEETGNFKKSLEHRKLFEDWNDSINNKSHLDKIADLELKYETAEKEKEIALLTKEREIQEKEVRRKATLTNSIIGGLTFVLALATLLFYLFRQKVRNQKLLSKKNAEITEVNFKQQLSALEMKALRAQMNPHFVFNCLNSINRMILGGDTKDASGYLTKFSRLIRKVLENSEKNMVSLSDELTMLKAYIQLETLRFKGKISYKTEIDKSINLDATYIPSMVLQPLVENAIWHGLMHKEKGGTIKLSIEKDREILKCSVEDDGIGREKNTAITGEGFMKEKSMGLQLTTERLKIMGKMGLKRFIKIIDLKDDNDRAIGTRVDLLIPIG
ncbi:MAG: tetratricopeptide repeat protein [Aurantibacter sp.]